MSIQITQTKTQEFFTAHKSAITFLTKTIVGSTIMAISAQITIPLPFVSITGQTLGLIVVSLSMGSRAAVASIILYLTKGALGLPVFALGTSSIAVLLGPSGGYLWGFIPAAFVMGLFADKGCSTSFVKSAIAGTLGTIITFAFGLAQLSLFVPMNELLAIGLYPFVLGGIIKCVLATLTIPTVHRFFQK